MLVSHKVHILIAPTICLQCGKYLTYVGSALMGILVPHFMDGIIIHRFTHRYPVVRTGRVVTKAVGSRVPAPWAHTHRPWTLPPKGKKWTEPAYILFLLPDTFFILNGRNWQTPSREALAPPTGGSSVKRCLQDKIWNSLWRAGKGCHMEAGSKQGSELKNLDSTLSLLVTRDL